VIITTITPAQFINGQIFITVRARNATRTRVLSYEVRRWDVALCVFLSRDGVWKVVGSGGMHRLGEYQSRRQALRAARQYLGDMKPKLNWLKL